MAIISYRERMSASYAACGLGHLYQSTEPTIPLSQSRPGRLPATHYRLGDTAYARCGVVGKYLYLSSTQADVTCARCMNGHFKRK